MKHIFKISLCLLAGFIFLSSCNEVEPWTPGPEDNEVGVQAYFPKQGTFVALSPDEVQQVTATIMRKETDNAVSIPINVTCISEGLTYPSTVEFAAGQEEAQFVIDCSGLPRYEFQTITIDLPDDQTDVYGDGMTSLSMSVIISEWKVISDKVTYYYGGEGESDGLFPNTYGKMYHLDYTNYFRFTDFYASGLDVMIEVTNSTKQNFTPLNNAYWMTDSYGYNVWYLYDETNNDWFTWYPDKNSPLGISYFYAYGDGYSKIYMIYNKSTLYGYASIGGYLMYPDETWSSWLYLKLDFKLNYNPFN